MSDEATFSTASGPQGDSAGHAGFVRIFELLAEAFIESQARNLAARPVLPVPTLRGENPAEAERRVLVYLRDHGPSSPRTLRSKCNVRPAKLGRILAKLEIRHEVATYGATRRRIYALPPSSGAVIVPVAGN